eukprot:TRINITY_DN27528_c0_g4_i1.p1 TRINITY_DN27528_c0_g4~~TRINITY_DN27528_c0_g4_i1.p1  ORF type:complete len:130 (-),score=22.39 TRINITY_DN27528_c0_g4_i1:76-465(-)
MFLDVESGGFQLRIKACLCVWDNQRIKKHLWDLVVDWHEKKLSSWKGRYLSLGGLVILIKSNLSSIPIYILSYFRYPKSVVLRIEKLQRDFLWNDIIDKRKLHLVKWEVVCKPTADAAHSQSKNKTRKP